MDSSWSGGAVSGQERVNVALTTGTSHMVVLLEDNGTIVYASPSAEIHLGRKPEEVVGSNFLVFIHPEDLPMAYSIMAAEVSQRGRGGKWGPESDVVGEYRLRHADGSWVPFEILGNNFLAHEAVNGLLIVGRPVWARFALDEALGVLAYDADGAEAIAKLVEYLDGRLPGTASAVMIHGEPPEWIGGPRAEAMLGGRGPWERAVVAGDASYVAVGTPSAFDPAVDAAATAGGYRACWCVPVPIRDPKLYQRRSVADGRPSLLGGAGAGKEDSDTGVSGCLVVWSQRELSPPAGHLGVLERVGGLVDLAIKRRVERQRMRRMVEFDHVTGALSRIGLDSMTAGSTELPRARLLIDLDNFKDVNDRYGHAFGDDVLRVAVKRLTSVLRYQDLLGRWGGDEFLLLVAGREATHAVAVAERILAVLDRPITIGSVSVRVQASIGIAPYDPDATPEELAERADRAMYEAKRGGKNAWSLWADR